MITPDECCRYQILMQLENFKKCTITFGASKQAGQFSAMTGSLF
jgi:hypothetical protein